MTVPREDYATTNILRVTTKLWLEKKKKFNNIFTD